MVTCWILSAILRFLVKGEWVDMPLFSVSIGGIFCGAVVGVITVFIAAHSPAKQAAKISPVAAISGNAEVSKNVFHAANTRFFKVETSLGIHHAAETKKNLFLMTGSFALTIVLFLFFSACLDVVHKLLPSVSDFTPDISEVSGVESAFGMMLNIEYPVEINGNAGTIDLFSYGKIMMDNFKKSVISGDYSKVYEDSGYALAVYNQDKRLNVGDIIKIGDEEIEIACVVSEGVGSVSGAATKEPEWDYQYDADFDAEESGKGWAHNEGTVQRDSASCEILFYTERARPHAGFLCDYELGIQV